MTPINQSSAYVHLQDLSKSDRHSILIDGVQGCGKTYLSMQYGKMVNCVDMFTVNPTVNEIRNIIQECYNMKDNVLISIENLDSGVPAASYALLKFLEEPLSNVYIVVTCRNMKYVPDTIISRSTVVSVAPPTSKDLSDYAITKDRNKFEKIRNKIVWSLINSYSEVDNVLSMNSEHIDYFSTLSKKLNGNISSVGWIVTHYEDNTPIPLEFSIRFLLSTTSSSYLQKCCYEALKDCSEARISQHAIISKLLFEFKYGG